MVTRCSNCGRFLVETEDKYCICNRCNRFTPKGANSYSHRNKVKGGNEMVEKIKKETDLKTHVQCIVCKKFKWTNPEVMKKRIVKFGTEEMMRAKYVCRDCKKIAK